MFSIFNLFDICWSCLDDGDKDYDYESISVKKKNKQIIKNQNNVEIGLPGII